MRIFIIFALCFVAFAQNDKNDSHHNIIKQCKEETGVDQATLDKIENREFEMDNKKLQCFAKCTMMKSKLMKEDGTIDENSMMQVTSILHDNSEKISTCKDLRGADSCETALLISKCFVDNSNLIKLALKEN